MRLHLERHAEHLIAQSVEPDNALHQARRQFGNVESMKEQSRDARGTVAWDAIVRDTRHTARRLMRDWRFTAAAVLILGLGIGANTATFSLIDVALFGQPPFADPERLVEVYQNTRDGAPGTNAYPADLDVATATSNVFAGVTAATIPSSVSYRGRGSVREAIVEYASPSYASVLGLRLFLGRWFNDTEDRPRAPIVTVLGHRPWSTQFGADPSVIGRTIRMEGQPVTIVGVTPAGYQGMFTMGVLTEFWLPLNAILAPRSRKRHGNEPGPAHRGRLCSSHNHRRSPYSDIARLRLPSHGLDRGADEPRHHDQRAGAGAGWEVLRAYRRVARIAVGLYQQIRAMGWPAKAYGDTKTGALLHIPLALAAGIGQLGKHGSVISREYGSNFRLATGGHRHAGGASWIARRRPSAT